LTNSPFSACISAALRLRATVDYLRSPDATYYVSGMALWCLAELTSAVLVFCIPAIPKIFRDKGVLTRFADTLRSWSLLSTKRTTKGEDSSWTTAPGSELTSYHRLDENNAQRMGVVSGASNGFEKSDDALVYPPQVAVQPGQVVRVTHFHSTVEDQRPGVPMNDQSWRTPWAQNGS
jgi:hypothetical protein